MSAVSRRTSNNRDLENAPARVLWICKKLVETEERLENSVPGHHGSRCEFETLFSELDALVKVVPPQLAETILTEPELEALIPKVRRLRAAHEFECEKSQALALLSLTDPSSRLQHMLETEFVDSALYDPSLPERLGTSRRSCLVVGSGPMPITALMLHKVSGMRLACLDLEEESCLLSRQVFRASGMPYLVKHITSDVTSYTGFDEFDVIFVNGLVGVSRDDDYRSGKTRVLDHVARRISHDCLLIMRSGYGLARIFYPEVSPNCLDGISGDVIFPAKVGRSALVLFELAAD